MENTYIRNFVKIDMERGKEGILFVDGLLTRSNIMKISLKSMFYAHSPYQVCTQAGHFERADMTPSETKNFDVFMDFMTRMVEKYGTQIQQTDTEVEYESRR